MHTKMKRLVLNRETVRALQDPDLSLVAGGSAAAGQVHKEATIHYDRDLEIESVVYCTEPYGAVGGAGIGAGNYSAAAMFQQPQLNDITMACS